MKVDLHQKSMLQTGAALIVADLSASSEVMTSHSKSVHSDDCTFAGGTPQQAGWALCCAQPVLPSLHLISFKVYALPAQSAASGRDPAPSQSIPLGQAHVSMSAFKSICCSCSRTLLFTSAMSVPDSVLPVVSRIKPQKLFVQPYPPDGSPLFL